MKKYHKIKTVFKRGPENKFKTLLEGNYSLPEFKYLANNLWMFTEKIDGTNIRISVGHYINDKMLISGKGEKSQVPKFLMKKLEDIFLPKLPLFRESFDVDVCFYGEGYGNKIQAIGKNYMDGQGFVLFDIKAGPWWLKRTDVEDIAKKFGIGVVPIIGVGTLNDMVEMVRGGFNSKWGPFIAEGIVAKPMVDLADRSGHRIITKLKYKDFAHKHITK